MYRIYHSSGKEMQIKKKSKASSLFWFVLHFLIFVKNTLSLTIIENLPSLNLYNCLAKTTLNLPINYVNTL